MDLIETSVIILLLATIAVPLASWLRLPYEAFLVIGSALISVTPGLPAIQVDPIIVFELFLPPILFSAAYFTSWRGFKADFRPISLLAVGLVVLTTLAVAAVTVALIPGFTWMEGLLLGAIVSPTDASAATAIVKKLGAPKRFITVLEGESLINDATALTLYHFALMAIISGTFFWPRAVPAFFLISLGGAAIGYIVGFLAIKLTQALQDSKAETALSFLAAFISYLVAARLGVSGVISTVVCGLYFGIHMPVFASTEARMYSKGSWTIILFVINSFVFTLLGLEFPSVLAGLASHTIFELTMYGLIISVVVLALRFIWVFPALYLPAKFLPSVARRDKSPSWQWVMALGWAGMRGIVSLAAVLAIPRYLPSGDSFPHRDLMIFITYCVIFLTLIPPSMTLAPLIRVFRLTDSQKAMRAEAIARIRAMKGVIEKLSQVRQQENIPNDIYNEYLSHIERNLHVIQTQLDEKAYSNLTNEYLAMKKLTKAALTSERATLQALRQSGQIHDDIFHQLSYELDLEETRARSLRI